MWHPPPLGITGTCSDDQRGSEPNSFTDFFSIYLYFSPFSESSPISGLAGKRNATTTELLAEAEGGKLFFYITRTARNSGVGGSLKLEGQRNN